MLIGAFDGRLRKANRPRGDLGDGGVLEHDL